MGAGIGFCGVAIPKVVQVIIYRSKMFLSSMRTTEERTITFQLKKSSEEGGFGFTDEEISWLGMDHFCILNFLRPFLFSESSSVCHNLHLHNRRHPGRVSGTKNCLLHRQPHLPRQLSLCYLCSYHAPSLLWPGVCVFPFPNNAMKLTGTWWSCPGYCVFSMWGKKIILSFQSLHNKTYFQTDLHQ